jgi:hypothetical protein
MNFNIPIYKIYFTGLINPHEVVEKIPQNSQETFPVINQYRPCLKKKRRKPMGNHHFAMLNSGNLSVCYGNHHVLWVNHL